MSVPSKKINFSAQATIPVVERIGYHKLGVKLRASLCIAYYLLKKDYILTLSPLIIFYLHLNLVITEVL
jgi:hypothetical protein